MNECFKSGLIVGILGTFLVCAFVILFEGVVREWWGRVREIFCSNLRVSRKIFLLIDLNVFDKKRGK